MLKRLCLLAALCAAVFNFTAAAAESPSVYYINDESGLFSLEKDPSADYYITGDIYLHEVHEPMFKSGSFSGNIYGGEHLIIDLKIKTDGDAALMIRSCGRIDNLILYGAVIETSDENARVGSFVVENTGVITNCVTYGGYYKIAGKTTAMTEQTPESGSYVESTYLGSSSSKRASGGNDSSRVESAALSSSGYSETTASLKSADSAGEESSSRKSAAGKSVSSKSKSQSSVSSKSKAASSKISSAKDTADGEALEEDLTTSADEDIDKSAFYDERDDKEKPIGVFIVVAASAAFAGLCGFAVAREVKLRRGESPPRDDGR